jgi:hypothetical protein
VSENLPTLGDAAAQMERTAQVPVSIPNDYASPGHKDPNESARKARLARVAKELDDESTVEGGNRALDRMDGKSADEPERSGKWERATGKAQTPEQIEEAEEQAAISEAAANAAEEAGEPPAEAAAEEAPKDDKVAALEKERKARFDKTLRMQAKAREATERIRRAEDALLEREDAIQARERALEESRTGIDRRVQLAERVLDLATSNPLELLERAGMPPAEVARWLQEAGDPTKQESQALRKEFGDLKATLERERASAKAAREQSEAIARRQQVENQFLAEFDGDKAAFKPARLVFSKKERVDWGNHIANRLTAMGKKFNFHDIADAVNELAKKDERWDEIKREAAAAKAATNGSTQAAGKPAPRGPAVAVNNSATQQRAQAPQKPLAEGATLSQKRRARLDRMYAELDAGKR